MIHRLSLKAVLLLLLLFTAAGCQLSPQETKSNRTQVQLIRTVDGDTLTVNYNGKQEKVRLLLIDTPEMSHSVYGKEPYAQDAKSYTAKMIQDAEMLELEFDDGPERDKYSRLLAYVYVDGIMLQEALLKQGLARVAYIYPPNVRYVDLFKEIEDKSQDKAIGIWRVEDYAQEDGFHPEVIVDP
ncbi:thermonuclease family protein [Paenibacillus wynnii]|uniref:thermonuclease family protein n=1 Tax=Paenibacillus wynnii TaxID=268407 RepID=UPI00278F294C|nr:thermonuclease family protein [Paenibacillus wynnii]MDQ0195520.1 micrococcal nuclease [Paenibacillus wynnii]